jgi:hypothetical protein
MLMSCTKEKITIACRAGSFGEEGVRVGSENIWRNSAYLRFEWEKSGVGEVPALPLSYVTRVLFVNLNQN